jgi:branched-chain amino acid aminotransferase
MPHFINYNGKILYEDAPIVTAGSRGLRYGDGVFETMKMVDAELRLEQYHFERLFTGLELMKFSLPSHFTAAYLREQVLLLTEKNNLKKAARIRLNAFRKNGGLYDPVDQSPEFVIEAWQLTENYLQLNENGLIVDVYDDVRKSCDHFSWVKSNNYLTYAMGAFYAKENRLDDCLILNSYGRICDATIANVFWVKDKSVYTPPLSEGAVAGVMRRHLLNILPQKDYRMEEKILEVADLQEADELFLTNATFGIRWVKEFQGREFKNTLSATIYPLLV